MPHDLQSALSTFCKLLHILALYSSCYCYSFSNFKLLPPKYLGRHCLLCVWHDPKFLKSQASSQSTGWPFDQTYFFCRLHPLITYVFLNYCFSQAHLHPLMGYKPQIHKTISLITPSTRLRDFSW